MKPRQLEGAIIYGFAIVALATGFWPLAIIYAGWAYWSMK